MRKNYRGKVYEHYFLRQSYREGGQVRKRTVGTLQGIPRAMVDQIRRILRGETLFAADDVFETRRTLPHGHVAAVLGTARRLGLDRLLESRPSRRRNLVLSMVVSRILDPTSKLATARSLQEETRCTSLGEVLQLGDVDEDNLYAALDWLEIRQAGIERKLAKRHLSEGCLVLYDLTSVAYTGSHCPLAEFGYPPEHAGRKRYRQMRIGLVCTREGIPVSVEVFPGNTKDATTVHGQVQKLRKSYQVGRVVLVGDRGVLAEIRLREDVAPEGLDWITALRAPTIDSLIKAGSIQLSLFDQHDLAEITSPDYPGERLIACRNPLLAKDRAQKREALLQATEKQLDVIVEATRRPRRPLRGQTQIALRVGKVVDKYHMAKHFRPDISNDHFSYKRDTDSIKEEAALDGLYVIRTSVPAGEMTAEEAVRAYKDLSVVEQAFRCLKSVDLKFRPFYHRLEERVRAHAFLCMLAYYVEWHMRRALAPLLFDDEDHAAAEAQRPSVVAPAQRSPQAQRKAQTKRTAQGEPVHSFQTLLKDLATIARNTMILNINNTDSEEVPTFENITTPTPLQQRAFDLLEVALK
ncbi:MAG: IS1634 family transposase [Chloroflexi bacterium]|nr:IS1634 family transposase [Chloroflexota bacterium]